jgi:uncharacterized protein
MACTNAGMDQHIHSETLKQKTAEANEASAVACALLNHLKRVSSLEDFTNVINVVSLRSETDIKAWMTKHDKFDADRVADKYNAFMQTLSYDEKQILDNLKLTQHHKIRS